MIKTVKVEIIEIFLINLKMSGLVSILVECVKYIIIANINSRITKKINSFTKFIVKNTPASKR